MRPMAEEREDLTELLVRRGLTEDAARPDAVEKRHAAGGRTARENLVDLVDPGSFVEYGRYAIAAQRGRRELEDLIARTPADGLIGGTARVNSDLFEAERAACAVVSYDYTVLAGTQGALGHRKKDRLFELIERMRLPVVFYAEGGGGRPGDTDYPVVSALDTRAFALWAKLSGLVPRIAIVHGRCFAGNAVIAGCSDLIVATEASSLGMGGPAMIAGGGLGDVPPDEVGPIGMQAPNGVVDVVCADEAEATAATKKLLAYFQGATPGAEPDQTRLRELVPERRRRAYDPRPIVETLCDEGSVTFLRERFAPEMVTALARIEGRPLGIIANDTRHTAGAVTSDAADKAARLLQLCDAFGLPVVSLVDTPGYMVGPDAEATGLVRHASRLLVAGAALRVPLIAVILRRGYGLGAQAMVGGSLHEPLLTVAWPSAHLGPMGLEGAVRLALRKELEAIADEAEREQRVRDLTAQAEENAKALNAAALFELDDVIDPAETRALIASTLIAAGDARPPGAHRFVDTW